MKVQILMSTYNGGRYIRTQLDSIIKQSLGTIELLIRDDGSKDDTIEIIKEYQRQYPWITLHEGKNLGVQRSFFELLKFSNPQANYIAFADQDDFWMPKKLERAVFCLKMLEKKGKLPLLYCGSQMIVDEDLKPLTQTVSRTVRKPSFGNALVQNICTGCTAVINQELVTLIRENMPTNIENIVMHDWWLYLTASCFGAVYYDDASHIKYRQHRKNVHGAIHNRRALLKYRFGQLVKPRGEIYKQAKVFEKSFSSVMKKMELKQEMFLLKKLILAENKFINRIGVALDKRYFRQKKTDDLVFRGILLIGKL